MATTPHIPTSDEELRALALARIKARRDFATHLVVYLVVNTFLWTAWWVTEFPTTVLVASPIWVTLGWGIAVVLNAWAVFRRPVTEQDVQRELETLHRAAH